MLKSIAYYVLITLVSFCLILCRESGIIEKTDRDSGSTCEITIDNHLRIVLDTSPTTGYQWEITAYDSTILTFIKSTYLPDQKHPDIVGSSGKTLFEFHAIKKGETKLTLVYLRPFEEDIPPIKQFDLNVAVKK